MSTFVCTACRSRLRRLDNVTSRYLYSLVEGGRRHYTRPPFAPKPVLDLKHMRQNPGLYEQNCVDRKYDAQARNAWRILELHEQLVARQAEALGLRRRTNAVGKEVKQSMLGEAGHVREGDERGKQALLAEARELKHKLQEFEKSEKGVQDEMDALALALPNLSSQGTPIGHIPEVLSYINGSQPPDLQHNRSHGDIGRELDLLDFEASANTSGWGWYFLKNEGALLEQALVQYALEQALLRGWQVWTPPSLVYAHISHACGFMPRDQHGETQIYEIAGEEGKRDEPAKLVLAGTAEVPFAGSQAMKTLLASELPLKVIGPSRCYRAEAGARGVDTKGLYRVHEFTKVEMFAWTAPHSSTVGQQQRFGDGDDSDKDEVHGPETDGVIHVPNTASAHTVFNEMLELQSHILTSLNLHARVLEMPTADLGASAARKVDIEVYFPSRTSIDGGYGEVTSASMCGDYQARRLGTRVKFHDGAGGKGWAHTVNGTAMAVPRVLAAVLENGWEERSGCVRVPEVLRRWMPGGLERIGPAKK